MSVSPSLSNPNRAPWLLPPTYMNPGGSTYGQNGQDYGALDPGEPHGDTDWLNRKADPAAFDTRSVTSAGITGTGVSGQPALPKSDGKMTQSAANLLARGPATEPPPGMDAEPARYAPSGSGVDSSLLDRQAQPPPGYTPPVPDTRADEAISRIQSRTPPQMIGQRDLQGNLRPQDAVDPNNLQGKEKLGAKVGSWGQRLAMAVLAATKLAPAAMQIVHPEYSQQMGQYSAAQAADTGLIKDIDAAENAKSQAVYRDAQAEQKREQAADYDAREKERINQAQLGATVKRQADFTRSLGKPEDLIEHISADDPQIPQLTAQGWQILDDIRYPEGSGMKVAKPPATVQVNAQNMPMLQGHHIGEIVPWSEYKSGLAAYQKQQQALEMEKARLAGATPTVEHEKLAYQAIIQKLAAEGGISPASLTDVRQLLPAIQKSTTLTPEEKNHAVAYLTANPTPPSQGSAVSLRVEGMGQNTEHPVIDRTTGALDYRTTREIRENPQRFMPAAEGAKSQDKQAIFQDLHYNLDTAKNAVAALGTLDAGTRAALANQLQESDPRSAVSAFLHGEIGSSLSPQQQHAVQALAQLSENALSLRSVAGMGQGAQDLRDAIRSVLPSAKSADVPYMLEQLHNFEQVVNRLEAPSAQRLGNGGGRSSNPAVIPIVQQSPSTKAYRYSLDGGATWHPGQPPTQQR